MIDLEIFVMINWEMFLMIKRKMLFLIHTLIFIVQLREGYN